MPLIAIWLGAAILPPSPLVTAPDLSVRAAVQEIPRDTPVEVRTTDRQRLRGRLGEVRDDGFDLRLVQDGRMEVRVLSFDHVRSVRDLSRPGYGRAVLLGTLASLGVTLAALLALAARLAH